jgi:DNA recombination protein RmuC
MLAIQVMQQIHKDARMREAADRIRTEVAHMIGDVGRLRDRVLKLQQHFGQANEDVRQILISAEKVERRATAIEELEFDAADTSATVIPAPIGKLGAAE